MNVKDQIKQNPESTFEYYRKNELYYRCGDLVFRVPVDDTGDGSFNPTMKSITMMRWIRKEIATRENAANGSTRSL